MCVCLCVFGSVYLCVYHECLLVLQRVSGLRGAQLQLVRATPQEAQRYKEEEHQARLQAIHDAAGHQPLNSHHQSLHV